MRFGRAYLKRRAATLKSVAAISMLALFPTVLAPAWAQDAGRRILAAELLILRGDLARFETPGLSRAHRAGLALRIEGALGLVPWLLMQEGDVEPAAALAQWQGYDVAGNGNASLLSLVEHISERYPLGFGDAAPPRASAKALREARAIHETYCAGCHDGAASGDPDTPLPARDLFMMGRDEPPEIFLARLFNGIKGDETIAFENPLTDEQLLALWSFYRLR
jgi:hypothetical protein